MKKHGHSAKKINLQKQKVYENTTKISLLEQGFALTTEGLPSAHRTIIRRNNQIEQSNLNRIRKIQNTATKTTGRLTWTFQTKNSTPHTFSHFNFVLMGYMQHNKKNKNHKNL